MVTINYYAENILIYCGFNRRSNLKDISEDAFQLFEDVMLVTDKYIVNISKGFSEKTKANRRIVFVLGLTNLLKATVQ